tara:strand:- start:47 stop:760 length:714 start_codon:yes stop_codon:yes gene_type:complete
MPGHYGSSKPSAPPGGGATSLGSGRDYSPPTQSSIPSSDSGGNVTDPGFVVALDEQQARQQDPVFGDPDPFVDVPIEDRDTITSFLDNYAANVKANPLMAGLTGSLITLYQTGKARDLLRGEPGYEFLDPSLTASDVPTSGDGGQQEFIQNVISQLPYAITGTTPQDSMVQQYFSNLGMGGQSPLSSKLETDYNNAKQSINSLLGILPPSQQFGYSSTPYGGLMGIDIDYLKQRGLM